jgi:2-C-methyl-D-erythritol 4-phosphate cytidylyltransferase
VARLREALRDTPNVRRVAVHTDHVSAKHPHLLGEESVGEVGVVVVPVTDTVKEVVDGRVRRTVPRDTLVQVVGPWVFRRESLADALTRVVGREAQIAGMIEFCEAAGVRVRVLPAH